MIGLQEKGCRWFLRGKGTPRPRLEAATGTLGTRFGRQSAVAVTGCRRSAEPPGAVPAEQFESTLTDYCLTFIDTSKLSRISVTAIWQRPGFPSTTSPNISES